MTNNILFKGYFEYHFMGNLQDLFGERFSDLYSDVFKLKTESILKDNISVSTIPVYKKNFEIPFDFGNWKDIKPEELETNKNSYLSFILTSKTIDIISIHENAVVFISNNNEVKSVKLTNELHLFKSTL